MSNRYTNLTKEELYGIVEGIRRKNNIDFSDLDRDFRDICSDFKGYEVAYHKFPNKYIRGLSVVDEKIILLNPLRSEIEQNFDCAHELFHTVLHRNSGHKTFTCHDYAHPNQDKYLEWQANEAGAEILIPYKKFIPDFTAAIKNCSNSDDYKNLIIYFAGKYRVTQTVVKNRIDALKYEIYQHEIDDVPINELVILSDTRQRENNIFIPSYHDRFLSDGTKKAL